MAKGILKNYSFNTATKVITLTDIATVRLDKLVLITDVTTNKILYNFASNTVTATVSTNTITLSALQGGENNTDKLQIIYDVESSDTSAFADVTQPVSLASVPSHAVTNAGTFAVQADNTKVGGTSIDTNSGNKSAGTQRVVIATDQPELTNAQGTYIKPSTTDNSLTSHTLIAAATTNATSVKGSAGKVYYISLSNSDTVGYWFKMYNKASAPTVGTDVPIATRYIPPGGGREVVLEIGNYHSTGIAYAITLNATDADTTAVTTANKVTVAMRYI